MARSTTQHLGRMTVELHRFAGLPSSAELAQSRCQLGDLERVLATAGSARGEIDATTITIAVLERALAGRARAAHASSGRVRLLLPRAAQIGAAVLIAAATAALVAGRSGLGAIIGLVAFGVALTALIAPNVAAGGAAGPLAGTDPDQVRHHLGLARERLGAHRDQLAGAELTIAGLVDDLQLSSAPTAAEIANRFAELAESVASRREADKLANTVDAALSDLETKRTNARQQALAAAARRAGLDRLPDTTLPSHPVDANSGGQARRRHLYERLELTRRVLSGALIELEGRHPTLLTRAAAQFARAAEGLRIERVDDHGPVIVPAEKPANGRSSTEPQWAMLADLCLTVSATGLAAGDRSVPLILGGVQLGGSPTGPDEAAALVAAEADARQIVVITSDSTSYQRLLAARPDAAGVEQPSIRVLVTPPE